MWNDLSPWFQFAAVQIEFAGCIRGIFDGSLTVAAR